mgnify:CR=1 FL=1
MCFLSLTHTTLDMNERRVPHDNDETENNIRGMSDERFVALMLYSKTAQGLTPDAYKHIKRKNYGFDE